MHGLINRSIQCFLRDTYGSARWTGIAEEAGVDPAGFEALLHYDDAVTFAVLDAASHQLGKPRAALLEDLGTYLAGLEPLRRLLRFGGVEYADFLESLEELSDRVHLAVPDLMLPELEVESGSPGQFSLRWHEAPEGYVDILAGILRAMADDYGALVLIEPVEDGGEGLTIDLLDASFTSGRSFELARPGGA